LELDNNVPFYFLGCTSAAIVHRFHTGFNGNILLKSWSRNITNKVENNEFSFDLSPWFVSGFADAEASFVAIVRKNANSRLGWRVETVFRIGLHKRDLSLLKQIQSYFGGIGSIVKQGDDLYAYRVSSLKDILSHILPHFDKYPLITNKRADYLLWKEIVLMIHGRQHLSMQGLLAIVNIRASINLGLSDDLARAFPDTNPVLRPIIEDKDRTIQHPEWVAGFTTGEGTFFISINKDRNRVGVGFSLLFSIAQHIRDEMLIRSFVDFFSCGQFLNQKRDLHIWGCYRCTKFTDNYAIILEFFKKYPIRGSKAKDFADWAKAADIIKNGGHLTEEGAAIIHNLKAGMNTKRII
jgi:hypothetical protein